MAAAQPNRSTSWLRRWLLLNVLLLGLTGLAGVTYPVEELSRRASDLYFRLRAPAPASAEVALVGIDDQSLARYGRWPWSRSLLAKLVRAVSAQHPRAIGLDILLAEPQDARDDQELATAIRAAGNVILAAKIGDTAGGRAWVDPLPVFASAAAGVGHVQAELGPDGICRRVPAREMTLEGPRPAFALEVARMARGVPRARPASLPAVRLSPQFLVVDYRGQIAPHQSPFLVVSAADLLDGRSAGLLQNKAALIGFASTEITDRLATPVSSQLPMPGVEIHANLLDGLLAGRDLRPLGGSLQMALLTGASLLLTWVLLRWSGWIGLSASAGLMAAGYAAGYWLFAYAQRQVSLGPFLVLIVLALPLAQLQNLLEVDRGLTRSLIQLRETLQSAPANPELRSALLPPGDYDDLPWKLAAVNQLEAELSSLYAFNRTLLDSMQQALAVFAPAGRPVFWNPRWETLCRQLSWNKNSSLQTLLEELGQPGWHEALTRPEPGAHGPPLQQPEPRLETQVLNEHGLWNVRLLRLPATSLAGPGASLLVVTDLTAQLERDRARAEALGFVTHELRTPLVSIQGYAEFLLRYPGAPGSGEAADTIFRESRRLVAMINSYLDVLRMESGARPMRRENVDIEETVKQVERVMRPLAQAADTSIEIRINADLPRLSGDAQLLGGALLNLVSNAVKYSPAGSVIRVNVRPTNRAVQFEVVNPGPVIPAEELAQLFEPFYRRGDGERSVRGWGLGLAFVKRIAEAHGGYAEVASDTALGTRFRITVPAESAAISEVAS
ncbi:MAG TPA: CHASE2 domain-containing protein [Terriglobia bacterium]|nr:CHASE2 domain-containing protein [Terriglobia bacterium]